jgi:hypothetical protein
VYCIVATTELVVEDDSLVAVLSDDVQIGFLGRNIDMFLILSVFDEDEPRLGTSLRSSVDSTLQRSIVARAVAGHYSVVETSLWLGTLHRGEGYLSSSNRLATARGQHALGHLEGVLCSILQSAILEDGRLAANDRGNLLAS